MNIKKKLQNPFLLAGEGFVAGAILFFATAPSEDTAPPATSSEQALPKNVRT